MRRILVASSVVFAILASGGPAAAEPLLAASLGQGIQLTPEPAGAAQATSIMLAPGYELSDAVRVELGIAAALDQLRGGRLELETRAMLVLLPPGFPAYGRLTLAGVQLVSGPRRLALGGSLGISARLGELSLFGELGSLPRAGKGPKGQRDTHWILEGRVGAVFAL